jgi:hypothetical protein
MKHFEFTVVEKQEERIVLYSSSNVALQTFLERSDKGDTQTFVSAYKNGGLFEWLD